MSQKSKKQARKSSARRQSSSAQRASAQRATELPKSPAASTGKSAGGAARSSAPEFNPDYSQTIKDLRRIGILAGGFFTLLLILSFFLR